MLIHDYSKLDYSQIKLSELELMSINNQIDQIKLIDLNDIEEEECNKIYIRACEHDNLLIIKFISPFCDKKIFNRGIYASLYFKHIESASWIFYNLIEDIDNFTNYIEIYLQVFFSLNNYDAIKFLLSAVPKFTCNFCCITDGFNFPCPVLVAIRQNNYESVKLFLDFLIVNQDYSNLDQVLNLSDNHGFYTACQKNYVSIAKYLCDIKPYYHIEIEIDINTNNEKIKNYYVDKNFYNDKSKYNIIPKYMILEK